MPIEDARILGDRLRVAREHAGLTPAEAGQKLGLPESIIVEREAGIGTLEVAELLVFARLYGKPPAWFIDT